MEHILPPLEAKTNGEPELEERVEKLKNSDSSFVSLLLKYFVDDFPPRLPFTHCFTN
jgi:hypothetical protein